MFLHPLLYFGTIHVCEFLEPNQGSLLEASHMILKMSCPKLHREGCGFVLTTLVFLFLHAFWRLETISWRVYIACNTDLVALVSSRWWQKLGCALLLLSITWCEIVYDNSVAMVARWVHMDLGIESPVSTTYPCTQQQLRIKGDEMTDHVSEETLFQHSKMKLMFQNPRHQKQRCNIMQAPHPLL